MSIYLKDKLKSEIEDKYKIDFNELDSLSESIKERYFIDRNLKLFFETYVNEKEDFISVKVLNRKRIIEEKEYSFVSDNDLYKRIEYAFELWYLLYDYINIEILWNKEVTKNYDNDYKFLRKIVEIYLVETEELVKDIEKYELGGISNEKDTNENVCCYKRKI